MTEKKLQKIINRKNFDAFRLEILSMLSSMCDYNLDESINDKIEFLEWSLIRFGFVAIAKKDEKYYIGYISGYEFDEYGLPVGRCSFHTRHGNEFECTIGEDCVVGYNNNIRTPEFNIEKFADLFNEVDKSIKVAIKKSRLNPIPIAKNSKVQKAITDAMDEIEDGTTKIILQDTRSAQDLLSDDNKPIIETATLTAPEEVTRIQYLSKLHDDLLRRVCTFYGQPLSGTNKMAQVNSDELKGYETYSMIYPHILLNARKTFIDKCNKTFGVSWSVEFSEAWKHLEHNNAITPEDVDHDHNPDDLGKEGEEDDV